MIEEKQCQAIHKLKNISNVSKGHTEKERSHNLKGDLVLKEIQPQFHINEARFAQIWPIHTSLKYLEWMSDVNLYLRWLHIFSTC